jgi:hypothetical protein
MWHTHEDNRGRKHTVAHVKILTITPPPLSRRDLPDKCQTDYVYVGLAYDNVDLNDNYNGRNIVLRAGDGSFRVFSSSQGCFGGYRTGDNIRVEVDMSEKTATFYKNDQLLCLAGGISGPMRPFVSIGSRDVSITLQVGPNVFQEASSKQRFTDTFISNAFISPFWKCAASDYLVCRRTTRAFSSTSRITRSDPCPSSF